MNALLRHHGGPCLLPNRYLRGHTQWPKISMLRTRPVASRWHAAKASVTAPPAELKVAGSKGGAAHLALNVAPARSAKGLVHRYLMYVRANARQVGQASGQPRMPLLWGSGGADCVPNLAGHLKYPDPR